MMNKLAKSLTSASWKKKSAQQAVDGQNVAGAGSLDALKSGSMDKQRDLEYSGWSQASTKERDDLAAAEVGFPRNAQGDFTPVPASSYSVHLMPGRGHANGGDVYASGDTSNTAFEDNDSRPSIEEEYDDVDTRRSIEHVENIPVSIALPEHDADAAVTVSKSNMRPSIAVNTPWGPVMNGSNALRKAFNPSGQDQSQSLGIVLGQNSKEEHFVKLLIPGQPASEQGKLKEGDVLLQVNGNSLTKLSIPSASKLLKGTAGSIVELLVRQNGEERTLSVTLGKGINRNNRSGLLEQRPANMLPPESPGSNLFREFENTLEELQPPEPAFIPDLQHNSDGNTLSEVVRFKRPERAMPPTTTSNPRKQYQDMAHIPSTHPAQTVANKTHHTSSTQQWRITSSGNQLSMEATHERAAEAERQRDIERQRGQENQTKMQVQLNDLQSLLEDKNQEILELRAKLGDCEMHVQSHQHEIKRLLSEADDRERNARSIEDLQRGFHMAHDDIDRLRKENTRLQEDKNQLSRDLQEKMLDIPARSHLEWGDKNDHVQPRVIIEDNIVCAGVFEEHNSSSIHSSPGTPVGKRTPARRTRSLPGPGHHESPSNCPSKNEELRLLPDLVSMKDWRGDQAIHRSSPVYTLARNVVERMGELVDNLDMTEDLPDSSWQVHGLLNMLLGSCDYHSAVNSFESLAVFCESCIRAQPPCIEVSAPCKVFGDIHGQLRDLLLLFREFGFPSHRRGDVEYIHYIFNGDFVDRGAHQLECVTILFALKILYPTQIILLRGNHEFREQNEAMGETGFLGACHNHLRDPTLAQRFYELSHQVFDWLPLSSIINGSILVLHGGIGDGTFTLNDLRHVERPIRTWTTSRFVEHVLWSDPSDSDSVMRSGVHGSPRGETCIEFFCKKNDVKMIVRAHQFVDHGYKVMHSGQLLTVFSARNYLDMQSNDSALLLVAYDSEGNLRVRPKRIMHREGHYEQAPSYGSPCLEPYQFQQLVPPMHGIYSRNMYSSHGGNMYTQPGGQGGDQYGGPTSNLYGSYGGQASAPMYQHTGSPRQVHSGGGQRLVF